MSPAAYAPPRHPAPTDLPLASNEGRAPRDLPAQHEWFERVALARYPRTDALREMLAARMGLPPERVLVAAGGADVLLRVALAHLGPGRAALAATPTFEMIPRYAALAGAELRSVPWTTGPYPVDALCEALGPDVGVVFLVTPNNPTGLVASAADLERLAARAAEVGARVLLDHAYVELADEDLTGLATCLPGVVVLRTLSKAWGLAGLRVGYALAEPEEVAALFAAGSPFPVSAASLAVARTRLETGAEDVADYVARVRVERDLLRDLLLELGARAEPSQTNFVLARVADPTWLRDALAGLGIAVRIFSGEPLLSDAVRIGCPGEQTPFARLEAALRAASRPELLFVDLSTPPSSGTVEAWSARVSVETGAPTGAAPAWALTDRLAGVAAARAAGAVPIAVAGPEPADTLLRAGAARALTHPRDLTELLP